MEHENCIPFLAKHQASNKSKTDVELQKLETLDVHLQFHRENKKQREENIKEKHFEEMKKIKEQTKPLLLQLKQEKAKKDSIKECKFMFCRAETKPLQDVKKGKYEVNAAKKVNSRFGKQYILSISELDGCNQVIDDFTIWSNKTIKDKLQEAEDLNLVNVAENLLYLPQGNLGYLTITGKGDYFNGKRSVYCQLTLNVKEEQEEEEKMEELPIDNVDTVTPVIPRENLLPYQDYSNLATLQIKSVHNVDTLGFVQHYGRERLVVSIGGTIFQAGDDLEENVDQLKNLCKIKLEKIRTNKNTKQKYAVCSVYEKGDWTALVEYNKVQMLPKLRMNRCVLDVRDVEVRGQKRKLILTDKGDGPIIYKFKKSKLEENVKVGDML